ncbi:1-phosphofructokinase [Pyxidicoccus xibeiensis]|uniref:1-phosphofructokinase n=1 Tax=Pyxidicoccus xibeiensis TaxID=2906759 RepID=UPI0020A7E967|nr:1-phosphofructokinase [Pyxidicoccus xibeiensis]MCP3142679.1 1-phosphofructokinase [Pyxidicoccus xibeiensis]
MTPTRPGIVTVSLNSAIDQTLDCPGFTAGTVNRVVSETRTAGGKAINVAAFLAGGPTPVTVAGILGLDNTHLFDALFRERGIHDRLLRLPGSSRVNIKVVDREGGAVTDLNLPGLKVSDEALQRLLEKLEGLARDNGCFVLAGSLPSGVPEDVYATLTARLRARGCLVVVDTSGAPLRHAVGAKPDFVKPNAHELSELLGRPLPDRADVVRAARELHATGIGLVVVSLGGEGAIFVGAEGALLAVPPRVEVASTVGAGDAMVAGVLAARLAGGSLEACARHGTAFAAGKLAQVGPVPPSPERVKALRREVVIHSLGSG